MSRSIRNAIFASAGVLALATSAATFAWANIGTDDIRGDLDGAAAFAGEAEAALPPSPAEGVPLFVADHGGEMRGCVTGSEIVVRFDREKAAYGGETVMLADGLEQSFADAWRRQLDLRPVAVSRVLAHVFAAEGEEAKFVDVVEVGADGCALSRTILSGDEWDAILKLAVGREV